MNSFVDSILIIGALISALTFFLARMTDRITLATESMIYGQTNVIVIASEVVKYFVFGLDADYSIAVQRCAFFAIASTAYLSVAILLNIFRKGRSGVRDNAVTDVEIKELTRRFEELRHNMATKMYNLNSKIIDVKSGQSSQQKGIDLLMVDLQKVADRIQRALEIFQTAHPDLFLPKKNPVKAINDKRVINAQAKPTQTKDRLEDKTPKQHHSRVRPRTQPKSNRYGHGQSGKQQPRKMNHK